MSFGKTYKSLRELCMEAFAYPVAAQPKRHVRGKAQRPYGEAKRERLDLHAQMMRERFGSIEEYETESKREPASWIKAPK